MNGRMGRIGLTDETDIDIDRLLREGYTQVEIARMKNMTRKGVNNRIARNKYIYRDPRKKALESWFHDYTRFNQSYIERLLRNHLEYIHTGGKGMDDLKLSKLASFYRKLRDDRSVVLFDPNIGENEDSHVGGYMYVPREERDHNYVLRFNEHTNIKPIDVSRFELPENIPLVRKR